MPLSLLLILIIITAGTPALAAEALSAHTLFERCSAFVHEPDSELGQLCSAYLRGFLQGAKASGGKKQEVSNEEGWTDRALRTRLGHAALARASYCVPENLTAHELAEKFVQHVEANPEAKESDASAALEATLQVHYQCIA
jgi:hypothetical protein